MPGAADKGDCGQRRQQGKDQGNVEEYWVSHTGAEEEQDRYATGTE